MLLPGKFRSKAHLWIFVLVLYLWFYLSIAPDFSLSALFLFLPFPSLIPLPQFLHMHTYTHSYPHYIKVNLKTNEVHFSSSEFNNKLVCLGNSGLLFSKDKIYEFTQ